MQLCRHLKKKNYFFLVSSKKSIYYPNFDRILVWWKFFNLGMESLCSFWNFLPIRVQWTSKTINEDIYWTAVAACVHFVCSQFTLDQMVEVDFEGCWPFCGLKKDEIISGRLQNGVVSSLLRAVCFVLNSGSGFAWKKIAILESSEF